MSLTPQANWFAFVVLLAWPAVALWLFHARPVNTALVWTILGGYLLLPVGTSIKFEGVPALDKSSISSLAAFIGFVLIARRRLRLFHGFGGTEILILMLLIGPFITSALNGDAIRIGERVLPGVGPYDALSAAAAQFIFLLPFFLARQCLRNADDNIEVLRVLAIGGLVYSLPMLFEVRMSPQLHTWIYGFSPSDFVQQIRGEGFRPVVFMGHGLGLAFFLMTVVLAVTTLWRTQTRIAQFPPAGVVAYLSVLLLLCKTLGAFVYGATLAPLIRWTRPRLQLRVALVLVAIALAYPALRAADLVPTRHMVELAGTISAERAESLKFRFDNEDQLLDRAWQRLFFGWGRFGRNRIYDDEAGRDVSVTDGRWIVTMGQFGFFGFFAEFGLLSLTVVRAAAATRFGGDTHEQVLLAALALIVAITMIDMLPNSSLTSWTWLLAGALLGRAESLCASVVRDHSSQLSIGPGIARKIGQRNGF